MIRTAMRSRKKRYPRWRNAQQIAVDLLGHNGGPPLPSPASWNAFCWRKAATRARRAPPREVLAVHLRRAAALGLDYATFAAILADAGTTPRTLVFVLSRSLVEFGPFGPRVMGDGALAVQNRVAAKLAGLTGAAIVLVAAARTGGPAREAMADALAATARAAAWRTAAYGLLPPAGVGEAAAWLEEMLAGAGLTPRTTLLIADPDTHRELATRARLAGLLSPERYFGVSSRPTKL